MKTIIYLTVLMFFSKSAFSFSVECISIETSGISTFYDDVFFIACKIEDQYFLQNDFKQIYVWDQANVSFCSVPFINIPSQQGNPIFVNLKIESTMFWVAEKMHNYFAQNFGWYGLDGKGSAINLLVLNRDDFGYCPVYRRIFIGKNSQATIDIIAHEIFHGISHAAAGLNNTKESAAIKESFSDIFGEVIEHSILTTNDWLVNALPNESTTAIRSLKNPNLFEDAKIYLTDTYWEDSFGGQYQNAGVQNHWFYIMSNGHENAEGIGIHQAAKIVFKTLTHYLLSNATYYDVRYASIQAARDVFGVNSYEQNQVALAWDEVGVFDLNNCVDTYIITQHDNLNSVLQVCNFISTQGNIVVPQNAQITLIAGSWVGINAGFSIPKNTSFTIKIN